MTLYDMVKDNPRFPKKEYCFVHKNNERCVADSQGNYCDACIRHNDANQALTDMIEFLKLVKVNDELRSEVSNLLYWHKKTQKTSKILLSSHYITKKSDECAEIMKRYMTCFDDLAKIIENTNIIEDNKGDLKDGKTTRQKN